MTARHDPYAALRHPDFLWFVASTAAFTLAIQIQATVVGWQVYEITRDPLALGLVGLAEALPYVGAALFAGHVADRRNRKRLSLFAIGVEVLCIATLLAFTLAPRVLAGASYAVATGLCVLALAFFARIAYTRRPVAAHEGTLGQNLTIGIRFLVRQKQLLAAQVLDLFSVLFGGAIALLPIFAGEILQVGPQGLGVMRSAPAAGAVVMSLLLAHRRLRQAGPRLFLCVAGFGVCWILFALSRSLGLSLALLFAIGALDSVSVVIRSTLLILRTPQELFGRVSAVNQIFIGSSNEIGSFESGVAAKLLGVVNSVVFGGLVTLGVVGVIAWKTPELRALDELS